MSDAGTTAGAGTSRDAGARGDAGALGASMVALLGDRARPKWCAGRRSACGAARSPL